MGILEIVWFSLRQFAREVITDPFLWALALIVLVNKYKGHLALQRNIYSNKIKYSLWELVSSSLMASLAGGIVGTVLISAAGITFYRAELLASMLFLGFFLMFFNRSSLGLVEAGGIIGGAVILSSVLAAYGGENSIFQYISTTYSRDIPSLLGFMAVVQILEGIMVFFDGWRGSVPVFANRENKIVAVFISDRLWILPLILYVLIKDSGGMGGAIMEGPRWWPFFKPYLGFGNLEGLINAAIAIFILLGRKDIAITLDAKTKAERLSYKLILLGVLLLGLAALSLKSDSAKLFAILFALIGRRIIAFMEDKREFRGISLFAERDYGVMVVDTIPDGGAEAMGLVPGDVVISINNIVVTGIEDIGKILKDIPSFIWVRIIGRNGKERIREYRNYQEGIRSLGIITVPQNAGRIPLLEDDKF